MARRSMADIHKIVVIVRQPMRMIMNGRIIREIEAYHSVPDLRN